MTLAKKYRFIVAFLPGVTAVRLAQSSRPACRFVGRVAQRIGTTFAQPCPVFVSEIVDLGPRQGFTASLGGRRPGWISVVSAGGEVLTGALVIVVEGAVAVDVLDLVDGAVVTAGAFVVVLGVDVTVVVVVAGVAAFPAAGVSGTR